MIVQHLVSARAYLGPALWASVLACVVGWAIRNLKESDRIPSRWVPRLSLAFGVAAAVIDRISMGESLADVRSLILTAIIAGALPIAGHATIKPLLVARFGEELAAKWMGQADSPPKPNPPASTAAFLVLLLALTGCSGFIAGLAKVAQGAQWVGSLIEVADAGQQAYFARHPSLERQDKADAAVRRARLSIAALDGALAAGQAANDRDIATARNRMLDAYGELRSLLADMGVLGAVPPLGGAETEAPKPEAFALPEPVDLARAL